MLLLKKKIIYTYSLILMFCFSFFSNITIGHAVNTKDPMSIWPEAEAGYRRVAIQLPSLKNEGLYRIELIPQQTMETDCNHIMIGGKIEIKPLTGWGYEYYILSHISEPASTRMACPTQTTKLKHIAIHTNLPFIRYNSKLPIVVYLPNKIRLSYRIWSAGDLQKTDKK